MASKATSDKRIFAPGPPASSLTTKRAMLRNLAPCDPELIGVIRDIRTRLLVMAGAPEVVYTCIPLQGSEVTCLEAVLKTTVSKDTGKVLVFENGPHGRLFTDLCRALDLQVVRESLGDSTRLEAAHARQVVTQLPDVTHVFVMHTENTSGLLNPVQDIGAAIKEVRPDVMYIVDATSSFGAVPLSVVEGQIDVLVSSVHECFESVPGFASAIIKKSILAESKGRALSLSLDLERQYTSLEDNGQFRFTPPVHSLLAFQQALREHEKEGGVEGRAKRYKDNNRLLRNGLMVMGFKELLRVEDTDYLVTSFCIPKDPKFDYQVFCQKLYEMDLVININHMPDDENGFLLSNIGQLITGDIQHLQSCIRKVCSIDMGISLPLT